jgi:hypothetical protein
VIEHIALLDGGLRRDNIDIRLPAGRCRGEKTGISIAEYRRGKKDGL